MASSTERLSQLLEDGDAASPTDILIRPPGSCHAAVASPADRVLLAVWALFQNPQRTVNQGHGLAVDLVRKSIASGGVVCKEHPEGHPFRVVLYMNSHVVRVSRTHQPRSDPKALADRLNGRPPVLFRKLTQPPHRRAHPQAMRVQFAPRRRCHTKGLILRLFRTACGNLVIAVHLLDEPYRPPFQFYAAFSGVGVLGATDRAFCAQDRGSRVVELVEPPGG